MLLGSSNVKYLSRKAFKSVGPERVFQEENEKYVQVLQHLCEPETFQIINLGRVHIVDVVESGIRDCSRQVFLETLDRAGRIVEIFRIPSHAPSIKVGLEHLGTQDIIRRGDVESVFVVKLHLLCRRRRTTRVVTIVGDIGKYFWTDPSAIRVGQRAVVAQERE